MCRLRVLFRVPRVARFDPASSDPAPLPCVVRNFSPANFAAIRQALEDHFAFNLKRSRAATNLAAGISQIMKEGRSLDDLVLFTDGMPVYHEMMTQSFARSNLASNTETFLALGVAALRRKFVDAMTVLSGQAIALGPIPWANYTGESRLVEIFRGTIRERLQVLSGAGVISLEPAAID